MSWTGFMYDFSKAEVEEMFKKMDKKKKGSKLENEILSSYASCGTDTGSNSTY